MWGVATKKLGIITPEHSRYGETLSEIATRLSREQSQLTEGQTERLSREQAVTLLSEASVRLREQTQALEQQAERLSHEQAQTLSALGEQLGRQQQEQISEQGQSLAEAQQSALRELAEGIKTEYGRATSLIPQQVDAKVTELVPQQVQQSLEQEVSIQLPDVVQGKIFAAVAQELETFVPQHFGIHEDGRMTIDGIPVGASLRGEDGKTPYIKDGTWWIGDTDTEVTAEVDKALFTNPEWLTMANLTVNKAVVADKKIRYQGELSPNAVLEKARIEGEANVAIAGGRRIANYSYEYFVIDDITKYGSNLIIKVLFSKANGYAVLYWQQGEEWHSVTEKRADNGFLLSAQLENPTGSVVLLFRNPHDWGFHIHSVEIFSPTTENIAYPMGTWLGRNKLPHKGDTYLCTNLEVKGERVLLAYDGHNWLTAWGAVVRGETTQEAKQAYAQAILALRSAIINPLE